MKLWKVSSVVRNKNRKIKKIVRKGERRKGNKWGKENRMGKNKIWWKEIKISKCNLKQNNKRRKRKSNKKNKKNKVHLSSSNSRTISQPKNPPTPKNYPPSVLNNLQKF
jgi:hypothetical protein